MTEKVKKPRTKTEARCMGWDAAQAGKSLDDCPWSGGLMHLEWIKGLVSFDLGDPRPKRRRAITMTKEEEEVAQAAKEYAEVLKAVQQTLNEFLLSSLHRYDFAGPFVANLAGRGFFVVKAEEVAEMTQTQEGGGT